MTLIYALDLFGTLVFAISGVLAAIDRRFDLVGSFVIGFVTAVGGGTLRDVMLGETPVGWMTNNTYIHLIILALPICYLARAHVSKLRRGMFLFDTVGIGLFTILGVQKTLSLGLSPLVAVMMGVVSASFGGVVRDVLANEIPLIFRKEIYATACALGAIVYLVAEYINPNQSFNMILAIIVIIVIRYVSVMRGWGLELEPLN